MTRKNKLSNRILSMLVCVALLFTSFPITVLSATAAINTVADPQTLTRPGMIYGDNTKNVGKITVGKSVSDKDITVNGQKITLDGEDNFLVTISQSAQVMGLSSEINLPLDVVIVFDTSGSMGNDSDGNGKNRTQELVEAANKMIASLMEMNELNRVGVVAFSAHNAGGGTAGYNAANVLSELAHYDGEAATEHLTWATGAGPSWAPTVQLVRGRSTTNGQLNSRYGTGGATNIQAGVTLGAELLMEADTTVEINRQQITRMPVMILMSDGAPTVSAYENEWWNASQTNNQGPTNAPFMGNGFLTVLTASYYKNKITEHYYGSDNSTNSCSFYTVGVELSAESTQDTIQEVDLSYMTLDPSSEFVAGSDNYYYDREDATESFLDAWTGYQNNQEFSVRVWSGQSRHDGFYYFYNQARVLSNGNDYKNGADNWTTVGRTSVVANIDRSIKTLHYNDKFYNVQDVSKISDAFDDLLVEIARKALTVPTKVTTGDHDFDGYVTFTDPIGEYMEVKDMKGVLAGGYYYRGLSFAKNVENYGTSKANAEFDDLLREVVKTRMNMTSSVVDIDDFAQKVLNSENQAYYNSDDDYDNSIVWWGSKYDSGEEDESVQVIGFADNDTVEYIEEQRAAGAIPSDADYVCRSYFFYGEAGGSNPDPEHDYLYFIVRVQRELAAPYRETVVISAPASLLSMEKVLVSESYDENGNAVYTATVEHQEPARVVYEVGLWESITPENVSYIVSSDYSNETVNGSGSVNYNPITDTYNFFTNDWDRTQSTESHHRGMAKATFDAAEDNSFYTYQQDTLIVDKNGIPVASDPTGKIAYYVREYYEWTDNGNDGTYTAEKKSVLIEIDIPNGSELINKDGKWYIPKGVYTSATLVVNGDDTLKDDPTTDTLNDGNFTGTSSIVAHPHRTGGADNSHYTVFLGNNGMLSLKADPYVPEKTVSVNLSDTATKITDDEGKAVKVGDVLTYTIKAKNVFDHPIDIKVTDYVPLGTDFVEGSAGYGESALSLTKDVNIKPDNNNILRWELKNVGAGQSMFVSFNVTVNESALSLEAVADTINNTASVQLAHYPQISTNTTHNPPYGKTVTDENDLDIDGKHGHKVGDILKYHVRFQNNATDGNGNYIPADVLVTDKIPDGTTYVDGSADNGGVYDPSTGVITWTFDNMPADTTKVVSFEVQINASAKILQNGTQPEDGEIYLPNTARVVIDADPAITLTTNTTENWADVGDMIISKTVENGHDTSGSFVINLTESTGMLDGTYVLKRNGANETVVFSSGIATLSIKHGDTLTIKGLPAGIIILVEEDVSSAPGWTPTYNTQSVSIVDGMASAVSSVSVLNNYELSPLTLTLKGKKNMTLSLPAQTTFGFVAVPDGSNPVVGNPLTGEVTVLNAGEYYFTFSPKTFTQPGIYKYIISEIDGGVKGVGYDVNDHTLIINVTDNGDGTMGYVSTLDGNSFSFDDEVVFTNTYTPDDASLTVIARKTLKLYDNSSTGYIDASMKDQQFSFIIVDKASGRIVSTGKNASDGSIRFDKFYFSADMLDGVTADINGNKPKVFSFVVSEIVNNLTKDPKMLYDNSEHEFDAILTLKHNGELSVAVGSDTDGVVDLSDTVEFTNYSNPDSVVVTPIGTKTTLNAPAGVTFSFSVINTKTGVEAATGIGEANGNINFSHISFTGEGEYTYWIKESNAGNTTNGITYDVSMYLMKVNVTRDNYNRLIADVSYYESSVDGSLDVADYTLNASKPSFHNEYNSGGYINITARKKLDGRQLRAGEFAFKLLRQDNGGEIDGIADENGIIRFSTMYYSEKDIPHGSSSAVIHYVMSEVVGSVSKIPGVSYDSSTYDVYVRITDNNDGTIKAELVKPQANGTYSVVGGTDTGVVFNNIYRTVVGDEVKFRVKKTLIGREMREGEFEFELLAATGSSSVLTTTNVASNDSNGFVTFKIDVPASTERGTYTFTLKEVSGTLKGVTYDNSSYTITLFVTDDGNGNIVAQLLDSNNNVIAENSDGIVDLTSSIEFSNTYTPDDVPVVLTAKKTLVGRQLINKEFSFVVRENNEQGRIVATASNDENGQIIFSTFDITTKDMAAEKNKSFKYVVMESDNNIPGVTVDDTVFTVTVVVTDDGTGALTAQINYQNDEPIVFENVYRPASVQLPLAAYKSLHGKKLFENEFIFELKDSLGNVIQTKKNDQNGVIKFDALEFDAEDMTDEHGNKVMHKELFYSVTELTGDVPGMEYDKSAYHVKVSLTDDGNGHLRASVQYYIGTQPVSVIEFVNMYTPPILKLEIEGTKTIRDTDGNALVGNIYSKAGFKFDVYDVDGNLYTNAESDNEGKIKISGFEFDHAGEYRFTARERKTNRPGYSTDATVWCIHITIGYNSDTGILYKISEYFHIAPDIHDDTAVHSDNSLNFVNIYSPDEVSLTLRVKKNLDGRKLHDNEFTFYLVDKSSGLIAAEAKNKANGDVDFHLEYLKAGNYSYTVYEFTPDDGEKLGGVEYSNEKYDVNVVVKDDGTGKLKAQVDNVTVIGEDTVDMTDVVIFHNVYEADSAKVSVEAFKRIEGKDLEDDEFIFELVNKNDPTEKYTAKNTEDGRVKFDEITFTDEGEYIYSLTEIKGTDRGVTYDEHVYTVTVKVTDLGNGKLTAHTTYTNSDGGAEAISVFHNYYKADPVEYTPKAKKVFEGAEMRQFDFILEGEGFAAQIKQNDEEGNVVFDKLTFENAGSYLFSVYERPDSNITDVKWDINVYTLDVEVIDRGYGQLEIGEVSVTSEQGRSDLIFRNVHKDTVVKKDVFLGGDTSISIDGKKVEKGDILTYTVTYKNYNAKSADVSITDIIPGYTEYVAGSVSDGGTVRDNVITWNLTNVAPDEVVSVKFDVLVVGDEGVVENTASAIEGENKYYTNEVLNPIVEDKTEKDVFTQKAPEISMDGKTVKVGDILIYKISYTNSDDFSADVKITDTIPKYTSYVENSADNGGIYEKGDLTWNIRLAAGETKVVSFMVKVDQVGNTLENEARAFESGNEIRTNKVSNPVSGDEFVPPLTGDRADLYMWAVILFISGGSIIGVVVYEKKRREHKTDSDV